MRDEGVVRLGKPIDNSRVVRQVDPRSRREILLLILLVSVLAAGLGLYAWPALEIRRAGQAGAQLDREKQRLVEENRKLRLEKAALENLRRVERSRRKELGLKAPAPERSVVVEVEKPKRARHDASRAPDGARPAARRARRRGPEAGTPTAACRPRASPRGPTPRERRTRLRLMLLALSISLWALVICIRLVHLQVLGREFFEQQGTRQSERTLNIDPRRGPILDRSGRPLAVSVDAESLYAVPQDVVDAPATAQALARALSLDAAGRREVLARLQQQQQGLRLGPAQARPRHRAARARAAARGDRLPDRAPPLLPAARARRPRARLRGPRQRGHVGHRARAREGDPRPRGEGRGPHRRAPAAGRADRAALDRRRRRHADARRADPAHRRARARPLDGRDAGRRPARVRRGRALHGRGAGDGGPPRLQPEPLQRLPELALAQPRRLRRLRARLDLQDRHRRGRDPGERRRPGRAARLRQRPDRDRRHRDQRPRRLRRS